MAMVRGIRRFLRFSLRSLLLVTLAVAAWLGYEVHQARTVQHQAEAIRALGGEVELEPSPWSLLRFFEPQTYGRRIVMAPIPDEGIDEALPQLESLRQLRELRVVFEGTCDQRAVWVRLHALLPRANVSPVAPKSEGTVRTGKQLPSFLLPADGTRMLPESSSSKRRCCRFLEKIEHRKDVHEKVREYVEWWSRDSAPGFSWHDYQTLRLRNGSLAEVLIISNVYLKSNYREHAVVLLVDDKCVDTRLCAEFGGHVAIQDVDGDVYPELAVESAPEWKNDQAQRIPGDPRQWLALYAIEPSGFRSLLPEDRFKPATPGSSHEPDPQR